MKKCKITVMRKACYKDLMKNMRTLWNMPVIWKKDRFLSQMDGVKPDGMCDSAWESMSPFVMTLAYGGKDIYNGWMKNEKVCNDIL